MKIGGYFHKMIGKCQMSDYVMSELTVTKRMSDSGDTLLKDIGTVESTSSSGMFIFRLFSISSSLRF